MSDATNSPQPQPQASAPAEIEVQFHGATRKIPASEVPKLVGIALQDEYRRTELKRMQDALAATSEQNKAKLRVADELERFAQANPAGARAFDTIYTAIREGKVTPDQVLAALGGGGGSEASSGGAPNSAPVDAQTRDALSQITAKLQSVESALEARNRQDAAREQQSKIDEALESDPFLKGRPAPVKQMVAQLLQPHLAAGTSIAEAVTLVVNNYRAALQTEATSERDRLRGNEALRTVSPNAGSPVVSVRDELAKIDPKASPIDRRRQGLKAAIDKARGFAEGFQRGLVQGQ